MPCVTREGAQSAGPSVTFTAGSTSCLYGSVMLVRKNGDAVWNTKCEPLHPHIQVSTERHNLIIPWDGVGNVVYNRYSI